MASRCKKCKQVVSTPKDRERHLCAVCAGEKKRCACCRLRLVDIQNPSLYCSSCDGARTKRVAKGKPPEPPPNPQAARMGQIMKRAGLRRMYALRGLDKIDYAGIISQLKKGKGR